MSTRQNLIAQPQAPLLLPDLPLADIDWDYFVQRRPLVLKTCDMPKYLLLPEIHQILDQAADLERHFLFSTLWHTGARISEALLLRPDDFHLDDHYPSILLPALKRKGRPRQDPQKRPKPRLVPLRADTPYITTARRYLGGLRSRHRPVFNVSRSTASRWLAQTVEQVNQGDSPLCIPTSLHTFRHSFAVNAILHFIPVPALQGWLGHKRRESTEVYTQILSAETGHLIQRVSF
ncbi:MAG TPA: site-specific integrase [Thiotrichales bacterium]|nr:site-specific integrase [Thiotrichales bacterium]